MSDSGPVLFHRIPAEQPLELALAELQDQLRAFGAAFPYGTWMCDAEGRAIHFSSSFLDLVGMTLDDAAGFGWFSRLPPDERDRALDAWRTAAQGREPWSWEHRIQGRDGTYRTILSRGAPIFGPNDHVVAWAGINLDITERAQSEARLRESEERFRTATQQMLDPIGIYRALRDDAGEIVDFEVVYVNEAAARANRMPAEEQVGRRLGDLLPSHHQLGLLERYARVVETGEPLVLDDLEYADTYAGNEEARIFDVRVAPLGDGFLSTWRDVTERRQRTRDLEAFRTRCDMVARATNDVIWDLDLHTGRVEWSDALARVLGHDPATIDDSRSWWAERIHPDDAERAQRTLDAAVEGEDNRWIGEYRFRRADGGWAEIHHRAYIARDADGWATRLVGSMLDVTEHRAAARERAELLRLERTARAEAEAALRERGELLTQLESLYRSAPTGLCVLDRDLRFVRINGRLAEMNGLTPDQHIGRTVREVIPEIADVVEPQLRAVIETGQPKLGVEIAGETPAQPGVQRQWVENWIPLVSKDGEVEGISIVAEEVTEQRATERALREAERRQRMLARAGALLSSPMSVEDRLEALVELATEELCDFCIVDLVEADGSVRRAVVQHREPTRQELAGTLMNWSPDQAMQSRIAQAIEDLEPRLIPEVTDELLRTTLHQPEHLEAARALEPRSALIVPLPGRDRAIGAATFFSTDPERHFVEADLEIAREVAERAALSIQNARLYEETREAVQDREDVLAAVSHDLRNPLSTIGMAASLILEEDLPDDKKARQAEVIKNAFGQALRLIEDLLEVTRLRSGEFALDRSPESPASMVEAAVAMAAATAGARDVTVTATPSGGLPDVDADRERLLRVLDNIISNGVRFTPAGGSVRVSAVQRGDQVRFEVMDTGPGIAPSDQPHVFDRFWRASRAGPSGTGLGLAIARGIVEAHGGRIGVESTPGQGSCFWFEIPVSGADAG